VALFAAATVLCGPAGAGGTAQPAAGGIDLHVLVRAGPNPVTVRNPVHISVVVVNRGTQDAGPVTVHLRFPRGLRFRSAGTPIGLCLGARRLRCRLGPVSACPPSGPGPCRDPAQQVDIVATAARRGNPVLRITATAETRDANPADNAKAIRLRVRPGPARADLSLSVEPEPTRPRPASRHR
jgi:hypothetical protein